MAIITREFLTGAANGLQVAVAATATPGTLIHTADSTATDEIYLYAVNNGAVNVALTIEWGGVTAADLVEVRMKPNMGLVLVIPGTGLSNSLIVRAFSDSANDVNIQGYVNRIT